MVNDSVRTTISFVLILIFGCADDSSSTASISDVHDVGIADVNSTSDAEMVAEPDYTLVDAQTAVTPTPNWTMPTALEQPTIEGVIIQPALALSDTNTLHLAFTVLDPDQLGSLRTDPTT